MMVGLKPHQAVVATFRTRNQNELSNNRQLCLLPNPNSKSSVVLGRSFPLTQSGMCVSVLLNTEAAKATIRRGRKLEHALPLITDYHRLENFQRSGAVPVGRECSLDYAMRRLHSND